jgi:hypothetical protein
VIAMEVRCEPVGHSLELSPACSWKLLGTTKHLVGAGSQKVLDCCLIRAKEVAALRARE